MRKENLEILLKRYYEGTSSPGDEELLRKYFNSPGVPQEFEAERAIFSYFGEASHVPEPSDGFEARIIGRVNASAKRRLKIRIYSLLATAAAILILISLAFFVKSHIQPRETFVDPQIAYAETMKILYSISVQLNKGTEALEPVTKMNDLDLHGLRIFNQSMKTLDKEMSNLKPLQNAIELKDAGNNRDKNN